MAYKKLLGISILLLLSVNQIRAQADVRYDIAKVYVKFLNTDTAFNGKQVSAPFTGSSWEDLKKHYSSLTGVSERIERIRNINLPSDATSEEKVNTFIDSVEKVFIDTKPYREKLPEYKELEKELDEIRENYIYNNNSGTVDTAEEAFNKPPAEISQSIPIETEKPGSEDKNSNLLSMIFFILLIILSGLVYYIWHKVNRLQKRVKSVAQSQEVFKAGITLAQVEQTVQSGLSKLQQQQQEDVRILRKKLQQFEVMQQQKIVNTLQSAESIEEIALPEESSGLTRSAEEFANTYYIRLAEYGNGFNKDNLRDVADGQCVFIVVLNSDGFGTFVVNPDSAVQRFALSNFDRLFGEVCDFREYPHQEASKIVTTEKGILAVQGNKLLVTKKVTITFA